jgi:hypothetical protein
MSAMAKSQKGKADAFSAEAKALLAKKSWFGSTTRNAEDAAECFEKAANAYKVGGLNKEAGDAYMQAVEIYRDKLSDFLNASKSLNSAGTTKPEATDTLSVTLYTRNAYITHTIFLNAMLSHDRYLLQKE